MKKMQSFADLAVFGAPPAFKEPLHVGRPNIGDRHEFMERVNDILDRRWLTNNGRMVQELESRIGDYLGVRHCIVMCNGTVALEIAIRALGLKGEVIVPSYTFIATAHALQWQEITPIYADIDDKTHNLDPRAVRRMITPRTTGIIGVHLWGRPCPIEALQEVAEESGTALMFDASHAFGCTYRGKRIGSFGRCEVFSFHATKFFNTCEGGAVVTNDDGLAKQIRLMKNFGFSGYDNVIYPGTNGKMTEMCAAMGITNFESLEAFRAANEKNYLTYKELLKDIPGLGLLAFDPSEQHNCQYVVIEVSPDFPVTRDELVEIFHAENVLVRRYFWPGCHNMMPYRAYYPHAGLMLPNTKAIADRVLVLPTGTAIDGESIAVIAAILHLVWLESASIRAEMQRAAA